MFAYGSAVTNSAQYERCAAAGIDSVAEPSDLVTTRRGLPLQRAYNEMLDEATAHEDLEAVVLLHQDLRIASPDFPDRVRREFADPTVGLIGISGAVGSTGLAWWDGAEPVGGFGTQIAGATTLVGSRVQTSREVDAVDGTILVLSAWAASQVRFDRAFEADFHGYDTDIAFQVRARGGKVMVADLWCVHERMGKIGERRGAWVRASLRFDRKWSGRTLPRAPSESGRRPPSVHEQIEAAVASVRRR